METLWQWNGSAPRDNFGYTTAGAGDVNADGVVDVIIGAWGASPSGINKAGSVFVYSGSDGSLLHRWDGYAANDGLGKTVCSVGDVNGDGHADLLMGAAGANPNNLEDAGTVILCSGADGSLLRKWNGQAPFDSLGAAVSEIADLDGDGVADVILSAPGSGMVYVFSTVTGAPIYQWNAQTSHDGFGVSVDAAGDVNQDGSEDILIGAYHAGTAAAKGVVYLYSGADGSLLYRWKGLKQGDHFGHAVTAAGDINDDGYPDIAIGAPFADPGGRIAAGSAYAFSGFNGSLIYQWDGAEVGEQLGYAISEAGDVDGDGHPDVIVGSYLADKANLEDAGKFTIFSGLDGTDLLHRRGQEERIRLGNSVAAIGDVNQDGRDDVVVGIYHFDVNGQSAAGSAIVLGFNPFIEVNTRTLSASAGGLLRFGLKFPASAKNERYKILVSRSGIGPTMFGVNIPLTVDPLTKSTYLGNYPVSASTELQGQLNARARGFATMTIHAGLPPAAIGQTFWVVAIVEPPGELPQHTSIVIPITVVP